MLTVKKLISTTPPNKTGTFTGGTAVAYYVGWRTHIVARFDLCKCRLERMRSANHQVSTVLGSVTIVMVLIALCLSGSVVSPRVDASAATHAKAVQGTNNLSPELTQERNNITITDVAGQSGTRLAEEQ